MLEVTLLVVEEMIPLLLVIFITYFIINVLWYRPILTGDIRNDRYVLITGCDSGFGRNAVQQLDSLGYHVVATCLTSEGVASLKGLCSSRLVVMQMDITSEDSVQEARNIVARLLRSGKGLWGIVNNAGISGALGPFEWFSQTDIAKVIETNVLGTVRVVRTFLPLMKRSHCGGGRIINTTSILGRLSIPFTSSYCMSKFAIEAFSDALRVELDAYNIKVSVIEPGAHDTNFVTGLSTSIQVPWEQLPDATKQYFGYDYLQRVRYLATKVATAFGSSKLHGVVNAYQHALFSRHPCRRYLVGYDAKLLILVSFLPSFILDYVLIFVCPKPASACRRPIPERL